MRFLPSILIGLTTMTTALAQSPQPELKSLSLQERYQLMKSTSQTFKDYKVIKETTLDYEWNITKDSIKKDRQHGMESKAEIARLGTELQSVQTALKEKEASVAETEHDAAHISFMGIDFGKKTFIIIMVSIAGALAALLVLLAGRLKLMHSDVKEKSAAVHQIAAEFEEYKRKSLEKQTKLSRELQNERNRLQELRKG